MAGLVTKQTNRSVAAFINKIENASKKEDSKKLIEWMESISGKKAKIWGNEKVPDFLIGFGKYTYTRKAGKEEFEWFKLGFAPRKSKITLYLSINLKEEKLVEKLGKCKFGAGCLYINKLADVDEKILKKLIEKSAKAKF